MASQPLEASETDPVQLPWKRLLVLVSGQQTGEFLGSTPGARQIRNVTSGWHTRTPQHRPHRAAVASAHDEHAPGLLPGRSALLGMLVGLSQPRG